MKYFQVIYLKNGERHTIVIPSLHKIEAIKQFRNLSMGVFIDIKEIDEPIEYKFKNLIEQFNKYVMTRRVSLEPYIAVLRHLAIMLDAGLPVTVCLQDVVKSTENRQLKRIFEDILNQIESGISLTKAFLKYKYELGEISYAMVNLGEQTGTLSNAITKLADILQEILDNRVRLKKAIRYPLLTMIAMIAAFGFIIVNVVPEFQSLFKEYNTTLPYPTIVLLNIESFVRNYYQISLVLLLIITALTIFLYRKNEKFRYYFDMMILKVFILGKVIKLAMIGRFIYVFERLSDSGVPITDSLNTSIEIVENRYIKEKLSKIVIDIEEGRSLTQGFEDTKQFPSMIIQMIKAGETSGSLNIMLKKISKYYSDKYVNLVDNVSTMIEPILIFAIASFVLLLAAGIFLPMWSMADAVNGN
ncbi:MAG: type II secretion system F family protein [Epsilonproteobacteria bacterium]|nr:type II secretion system F family protein [Campylobacterota bacterium]